jgi:hypothetical protein
MTVDDVTALAARPLELKLDSAFIGASLSTAPIRHEQRG